MTQSWPQCPYSRMPWQPNDFSKKKWAGGPGINSLCKTAADDYSCAKGEAVEFSADFFRQPMAVTTTPSVSWNFIASANFNAIWLWESFFNGTLCVGAKLINLTHKKKKMRIFSRLQSARVVQRPRQNFHRTKMSCWCSAARDKGASMWIFKFYDTFQESF